MIRNLFFTITLWFFCHSLIAQPVSAIVPDGSGTDANPYLVANLGNLLWISENPLHWNKVYSQTADINASATSTLNSGEGWVSIGYDWSNSFQGKYYGNGHIIDSLFVNRSSVNYQGFIGYAIYSTLSGINLKHVSIKGNNSVGALLGYNYQSTITNISSTGNVQGNSYVGGLIGNSEGGSLKNSYNENTVLATSYYVGGLVGLNYSQIQNSYNAGSVSSSSCHVGGLTGYNDGKITNCYSIGATSGTCETGGLIGNNYDVVENSFWNTETSGQATSAGGTGKTVAEMKMPYTFIGNGWDFKGVGEVGIWNIGNSRNNGYPYLNWQFPEDTIFTDSIAPTVHTVSVSNITALSAIAHGYITNFGIPLATQHGFCWNTTGLPTIEDSISEKGPITNFGSYSDTLPALKANTKYYIRAYAINTEDTSYGIELNFITLALDPVAPLGTGTIADPYQIASLANLLWIKENPLHWNKAYTQTADINASSTATWNNGEGWIPIGYDWNNNFSGKYIGNNFIIDSLHINRSGSNAQALFGYAINATISNVKLNHVSIVGRDNTAALVGYSYYSNIANVSSTGNVTGNQSVGGLFGFYGNGSLKSSFSECTVNASSYYSGGLVGMNYCNIENCYSLGSVTSTGYYVGGLVGYNSGNIKNSYSIGAISGYVKGGLIGQNYGVVENCFWNTETSGLATSSGGTGKTTVEMKTPYTFIGNGWDFKGLGETGIWNIGNDRNNDYPYLNWSFPNDTVFTDSIAPTALTISISEITTNSIVISGKISNMGIPIGTQHGFCWNTTGTPTITDSISESGVITKLGTYSSSLSEFEPNTKYYIRAYASNVEGTGYGKELNFVTLPMVPLVPIGDGSEMNPYQISVLANLLWLSENKAEWGKNYIQTNDINAAHTATWNAGAGWKPIGYEWNNSFRGKYNGNGYSIDSLTINRPGTEYVGLFGMAINSTVYDVKLTNVNIIGGNWTAGLMGENNSGTIRNCAVSGNIVGNSYVAGIAGYNLGNITKCLNESNVAGSDYIGGLAGDNNNNVLQSINKGNITGSGYASGGLTGYCENNGKIENSYNTGKIVSPNQVGGIAGTNDGELKNSYSVDSVTQNNYYGGIVGYNDGTVDSCYWDIDSSGVATSDGGTAKSTSEMKKLQTFIDGGWNFIGIVGEEIWNIGHGRNNGYPYLVWEFPADSIPSDSLRPIIKTNNIASINQNSALGLASFIYSGVPVESTYGFCWSTAGLPDTSNFKTVNSVDSAIHSFTDSLTGLDANTEYFVRAYALNGQGIVYGNLLSFSTLDSGAISVCEALDTCGILFSNSGDAVWFGQTDSTSYGIDAAKSGVIQNGEKSSIETTINGFGYFSFQWKVSSYINYNYLRFYIDGIQKDAISGEVGWQTKEYYIGKGSHIIKWEYSKTSSVAAGEDCAWVDRVEYNTISCPIPENLSVSDFTENSIVANWTEANTSQRWNLEWGLAGFAQGTGNMLDSLDSTSVKLTGIDPGTLYAFYVQSVCDSSNQSTWAGPFTFYLPVQGDNCSTAINLSLSTSPYNGSISKAYNDFSFCGMTGMKDLIYYYDVENGATFKIWQSDYDSDAHHTLTYGGACPGANYIDCDYYPGNYPMTWFNSTGSTQRVYYAIGGSDTRLANFSINWEYTPPASCIMPVSINYNTISDNSFELIWNEIGSATEWEVEYGEFGFTHGQGKLITNIAQNNIIIDSLEYSTRYQFYVRSNCGGGDFSVWSNPIQLSTACRPQGTIHENFDKYSGMPLCWGVAGYSYNFPYAENNISYSQPNSLRLTHYSKGYTYLSSPQLKDSIKNLKLDFKVTRTYSLNDGIITIGTIADPSNKNTFTPLFYTNISDVADYKWSSKTFYFNEYNGTDKYIAIKYGDDSIAQYANIYIDDFTIDSITDCGVPYNLHASDITLTSANINWSLFGDSSLCDLVYGPEGFNPDSSGVLIDSISSQVQLITNLNASTDYQCYVRRYCGADKTSWSSLLNFSTLCGPKQFNLTITNVDNIFDIESDSILNYTLNYEGCQSVWPYIYLVDNNNNSINIKSLYFNRSKSQAYTYNLPKTLTSGNYRLKIYYYDYELGQSNNIFTDTLQIINNVKAVENLATYDGEYILNGGGKNIYWNSNNLNNVNIYYSIDSGYNWIPIELNRYTQTGYYAYGYNNYYWNVQAAISKTENNCFIRIEDAADTTIFDVSERFNLMFKDPFEFVMPNTTKGLPSTGLTDIEISSDVNSNFYFYLIDEYGNWTWFGDYSAAIGSKKVTFNNTGLLNVGKQYMLYAYQYLTDFSQYSDYFTIYKTSPTVTSWPTASDISYGELLSQSSLTGGIASIDGVFSFTNDSLYLEAGSYNESVTFTPIDTVHYNVVIDTISITVSKANAILTLSCDTTVYDGISKSANTLTVPAGLDVVTTYNGIATLPLKVGTYEVISNILDKNYKGSDTIDLVITPAYLTITANSMYKKEGDTLIFSGTEFVSSELYGKDSILTVSLASDGVAKDSAIGEYSIIPSNAIGVGLENYSIDYVNGILTVTDKNILTLTDILCADKVFDGNNLAVVSSWGNLVGVLTDDTVYVDSTSYLATFNNPHVGIDKKVSITSLKLTGIDSGKYVIQSSVYYSKASITPKTVVIYPLANQTKLFTEPDPVFGFTNSEWVNNDNITGNLSRISGENVGNYTYSIGTLSVGSNYSLALDDTSNNFIINQKPIIIMPLAGQSKTFGNADAVLSFTNSEWLDNTNLSGQLGRNVGENVGLYAYTLGSLGVDANYSLQLDILADSFSISAKVIVINPLASQNKVFGAADPAFTYSNSEWLDNANFSGVIGRAAGENVGSYAFTIATLTAGSNYSLAISDTAFTFSILPKEVTISPIAGQTKVFGATDPFIGFTNSEWANNDSIFGNLGRVAGENVGSYLYELGSLNASSNYQLQLVAMPGYFEITAKQITISPLASQSKEFGMMDPVFTYTNSEWADNTNISGAVGRLAGEDAGAYDFTLGTLGVASNYSLVIDLSNSFSIQPRTIYIYADYNQSKVYGDSDPVLTYTNSEWLDNNSFTGFIGRESGDSVGTYNFHLGTLSVNSNYSLAISGFSTFLISAKALTIGGNFSVLDKVYDGTIAATIDTNNLVLQGLLANDVVSIAPVAVFDDEQLGAGKNVTLSFTSSLFGEDAGNYFLDFQNAPTTTASIRATNNVFAFNIIVQGNGVVKVNNMTYTDTLLLESGSAIALEAVPDSGWQFIEWVGDYASNKELDTISITANTSITAIFGKLLEISKLKNNHVLYPNPLTNILKISNASNLKSISILNLMGQKVLAKPLEGNSLEVVNTSDLANGVYTIQLKSESGETLLYKMIKK